MPVAVSRGGTLDEIGRWSTGCGHGFRILTDSGDRRMYLYESKDYGRSWTSLAGTLPAEPVNVIIEDPAERGILYLGTSLGVYVSTDDGANWLSLCRGLPTAPVEDMALHGTYLIDGAGRIRWQDVSYEPFMDTAFLLEESKRLLGLPVDSGRWRDKAGTQRAQSRKKAGDR